MPADDPYERLFPEWRELACLFLEASSAVRYTAPGEFQRSPLAARLRLALSPEATEVQERSVATPDAAADDPASLPLAGRALQDVDGQGAGSVPS